MRQEAPFNPLDKKNLGTSVADAMLSRPLEDLPPGEPFIGAGVYALYYLGNHPDYATLGKRNREHADCPIYVGKAVPAGARKGGLGFESNAGTVLYKRLREHAESIQQVENLNLEDFKCRFLVVDDIWIPLGESLLIEMFDPAWNKVVDGFGNHDPGSGRYKQKRSPWDVLHPGRPWAERLTGKHEAAEVIRERLARHMETCSSR
ncbi:MAG: Eco29kI family restriction endonuclease [Chloroflexota bacterium]